MNCKELYAKLQKLGLLSIDDDGITKKYIDGNILIKKGKFENCTDVFGIYKLNEKYFTFMTDHERGIPDSFHVNFDTESQACEHLYNIVLLYKKDE